MLLNSQLCCERRIHKWSHQVRRLSRPQTAKVSSAPRHGLLMTGSRTHSGLTGIG